MNERPTSLLADPARTEPFAARTESCTCGGGGFEPDPTDDNLRVLRELRDLSMKVAKKLAGQILDDDTAQPAAPAAAEDAADEPGDAPKQNGQLSSAALAFQRAERGVRQCILLSSKLHDDRVARATQKAVASAQAEQQQRERRKSRVTRLAKEAIERDAADRGDDAYDRLEKLDLRIDEDDIDSDIGRIADSAIVARLCKDCGVEPPFELWADEYWAQEERRRRTPGSVFDGSLEAVSTGTGPVEVEPPQPEPPQPEPPQPEAAAAAQLPEPAPPEPEPETPYETNMKARLKIALHSGAWVMGLQMDPMLANYVHQRLINSS